MDRKKMQGISLMALLQAAFSFNTARHPGDFRKRGSKRKVVRNLIITEAGKRYLRYSGAHLRLVRARHGVGRPPSRLLLAKAAE